eukprot:1869958-Pleurochrysis_carterae.AAC.1
MQRAQSDDKLANGSKAENMRASKGKDRTRKWRFQQLMQAYSLSMPNRDTLLHAPYCAFGKVGVVRHFVRCAYSTSDA